MRGVADTNGVTLELKEEVKLRGRGWGVVGCTPRGRVQLQEEACRCRG